MKRSKLFTNILVATAMVASISAATGARVAAAPSRATTTINFVSWSSTPVELAAVKKLITNFESKYKGVKISYQNIANNYQTAMKARLVAGTQPDVFWMNSDYNQDFIRTNQLKNLDFLKNLKGYGFNNLYKSLVSGYMYKGHVYGIPKDYSTLGIYYNKSMLKAAGIAKPPTTWAQFQSDACKLTDKSKKLYGAVISADIARWLPFVFQAGGAPLNKNQTQVTIDSGAAKTALDWYAGLVQKGCAALPSTVGAGWNGEAFGKQNAAMVFEGNWLTGVMHDTFPSVSYGIAPLPKGPKGQGNLAFSSAWVISAKTKHLKEASQFLEYVTGKQGMTVWSKLSGYIGSRKDVKPLPGTKVFVDQVKHSKTYFFPPGFANWLTTVGNDIQKVMEGKETTAQALSDMQTQGNVALNAP
jgi:multiple sugar transport system substrate-binding protein